MRDIEKYTQSYIEDDFEPTMVEIRRRMLLEQIKRLFSTPPRKILEVGCGLSPLFLHIGDDFDQMVVVEPSGKFCDNARRLVKERNLENKIIIKQGFFEEVVEDVKGYDADFDLIVVSGLLNELESPQVLLKAVWKLCSEKTIVHVNVPNAKSLHRLIAVEISMIGDIHDLSEQSIKLQQHRTYDMHTLTDELNRAGFSVISSGSYFIKPFTHAQMQKCLDEKIIDENVITGLEKISKYLPEYGAEIYANVKAVM